jgi:hypothetical protein
MRAWLRLCVLAVSVTLAPPPAFSQDAETLRRELDALRKQMESLTERLRRLESAPPPVAPPVTAPTAPPVTQAPGPPTGTTLSPQDILRPREPFSLYQRRGGGQLFFDMGIAGDFIGNITQRNVDKADAGSFSGRENRFFPREVEVSLFGQIDPYARGEVRIEAGEEAPGAETGVSLAEAHLTLLTLPWGTQAKLGQMRNRFGYQNVVHEHDLPWPDRPNVFVRFLGEEGLSEKGLEATWIPDFLPFYLEVLGGVFNGDNETAFGRGKLNEPLITGRIRTFFELDDLNAIQLGISGANGQTPDRKSSGLFGFDLRYKLRPDGWLHPLFTLTGEALYSVRRVEVFGDPLGLGVDQRETRLRKRFGWYVGGEVQPVRRWAGGVRYDWTEFPIDPGKEWAVEPYISFFPSDFLRFRLAYKHTERTHRELFQTNGGSGRIADEVFFQGSFILGAHPAHPF